MKPRWRKLLKPCSDGLGRWLARSYVAGPELADALRVCRRFAKQGMASTVCFWNTSSDSPRRVADAYLEAFGVLAQNGLTGPVAVKAPALGYASDLMAEITERSRETGVGIHFDSLGPEGAERTFALVAECVRRYPRVACTLPGRWRRSLEDAERVVELGVKVRVVKGEWADTDAAGVDLREGYLAVIDRLAGRARHVGVATHDPPLAREALRRLRADGTPCELELLFGLPVKHSMQIARDAGVGVRLYVPYGTGWLPYCLGHVRKNPRILYWAMRDALLGSPIGRVMS